MRSSRSGSAMTCSSSPSAVGAGRAAGRLDRERPPAGLDPGGVRRQPRSPGDRADRPLPGALARLDDGDAARGVVGDDGRLVDEGKALGGRLELRRRAARALRGDPPRRLRPAAALAARPRRALSTVVPWAPRAGPGCWATRRSPRGSSPGRSTASASPGFGADDWRREAPAFRDPLLAENLARSRTSCVRSRTSSGTTATALAIAWVLAPGVTASIVGARLPGHVDGWAVAADLALSEDTLERVGGAIAATGGVRRAAGTAAAHQACPGQ